MIREYPLDSFEKASLSTVVADKGYGGSSCTLAVNELRML